MKKLLFVCLLVIAGTLKADDCCTSWLWSTTGISCSDPYPGAKACSSCPKPTSQPPQNIKDAGYGFWNCPGWAQ